MCVGTGGVFGQGMQERRVVREEWESVGQTEDRITAGNTTTRAEVTLFRY